MRKGDGCKQKEGCSMDKKGRKGKKKKRKEGKQTRGRKKRNQIYREREKGETEKNVDFLGIPTVKDLRSEKKSRSTHRELRMSTKILEFCQIPQGREFSYLNYF